MIPKDVYRMLALVAAVPIGLVAGFYCGYEMAAGILNFQGKGNSHDDMITVVIAGGLGAAIGSFVLPFIAWFFTRHPRK